jgi:hypothetical protein
MWMDTEDAKALYAKTKADNPELDSSQLWEIVARKLDIYGEAQDGHSSRDS